MKWENRDINVAEKTNIPKFSKLEDIGAPFRLFFEYYISMATPSCTVIERKQTQS